MKVGMRGKSQVYSVGNYLMTGKVLGKGHFARVEEATHRIIGKKVAIKIIDLTCIKEEYARRNLHREPRVMAKLRHPCIAALYETMMHGPRLYVVMEAACGGDLCALVLAARGARARGLPEVRARCLAAQLVSAVRHMHSRGVVHRDLKMENIMLDASKQYIKIVDFGLSNLWSAGGALRTPCGSLEYAAPELFVDGRKYGPEVDLWSIGVIVYGMVTGGLPFTGAEGGTDTRSRPLLRAAIARGFGRKQRAALACSSPECKSFIQHLLEPNVENRMKIDEAARHRWLRKPGMRMRTNPLPNLEPQDNREIYKQISELCGQPVIDVVAEIKADPFGAAAGIYNIKTHLRQMQAVGDLLWDNRPLSPPPRVDTNTAATTSTFVSNPPPRIQLYTPKPKEPSPVKPEKLEHKLAGTPTQADATPKTTFITASTNTNRTLIKPSEQAKTNKRITQSPRFSRPFSGTYGLKTPIYNVYDNGDCGLHPRLPSIDEHSNLDLNDARRKATRTPCVKKINLEDEKPIRLNSCPVRNGDAKRSEFYRRAGDGLPSWRASGAINAPPARILLQNNATTIKRASLGNIVSPHSSTNSHCKSERSMPVGWYSTRIVTKEPSHLQRLRRTMALK